MELERGPNGTSQWVTGQGWRMCGGSKTVATALHEWSHWDWIVVFILIMTSYFQVCVCVFVFISLNKYFSNIVRHTQTRINHIHFFLTLRLWAQANKCITWKLYHNYEVLVFYLWWWWYVYSVSEASRYILSLLFSC